LLGKSMRPSLKNKLKSKRTGVIVQVIKPSMHEALDSMPSTKKKKQRIKCWIRVCTYSNHIMI
jgi:hypothetical protein